VAVTPGKWTEKPGKDIFSKGFGRFQKQKESLIIVAFCGLFAEENIETL